MKIEKIINGLTVWYRKLIKELSWLSGTIWAEKYFLNKKFINIGLILIKIFIFTSN